MGFPSWNIHSISSGSGFSCKCILFLVTICQSPWLSPSVWLGLSNHCALGSWSNPCNCSHRYTSFPRRNINSTFSGTWSFCRYSPPFSSWWWQQNQCYLWGCVPRERCRCPRDLPEAVRQSSWCWGSISGFRWAQGTFLAEGRPVVAGEWAQIGQRNSSSTLFLLNLYIRCIHKCHKN